MKKAGERLEEIRERLDIKNKKDFADILGVTPSAYYKYYSNLASPKKILYKLEKIFNINAEWILTGKGEMFNSDEICNSERHNIKAQENQLLSKLEKDGTFDNELLNIAIEKLKNRDDKTKERVYHLIKIELLK
jgi:transcriptional regulator with XRE-family HTH domain